MQDRLISNVMIVNNGLTYANIHIGWGNDWKYADKWMNMTICQKGETATIQFI